MKLGWKDFAIILAIMLVVIVAVKFLFPQTVEANAETKTQEIKTHFLKKKKA